MSGLREVDSVVNYVWARLEITIWHLIGGWLEFDNSDKELMLCCFVYLLSFIKIEIYKF